MASLVSRVSSLMDLSSGKPPASVQDVDLDGTHDFYLHALIYGPAGVWKTSTAALFGGPERTAIIVTRRKEQMIPLKGKGFKNIKVAQDAEALKYLLTFPEVAFGPAWANRKDRVLVIDDITEGQTTLVDDHKHYFDEKKSEWVTPKDPRKAYGKAGEEYHDLLKMNLGKPQHVILTAVERNFNVEGTIDWRTEPDVPNKVMILTETELEFVFYMELEKDEMLTRTRSQVRETENPDTKRKEMWREITFAKQKLPLLLIGKNILAPTERKDLIKVWEKISTALNSLSTPAVPAQK